jgi:regulator of sirC expression with transglutaminase-like and TPR domain
VHLSAPLSHAKADIVRTLRHIFQVPGCDVPLDLPALEIAFLERPDLDPSHYLELMDGWAIELKQSGIEDSQGYGFLGEFHRYFFEELRFRGNTENYYSPRNSFLNEVLDCRKGIPITLSVVYMELARRLGRKVHGISFPGHFLVRVGDGDDGCYVDVFHQGRLMDKADCIRMGLEMTGIDYSDRPSVLAAVDPRAILLRMLHNLRGIYLTRRSNRKLLAVQDLLLLACPEDADEYFSRAMVKMNLHLHASAERDLLRFLQLRPKSEMRQEVERQLHLVRLMKAQMN